MPDGNQAASGGTKGYLYTGYLGEESVYNKQRHETGYQRCFNLLCYDYITSSMVMFYRQVQYCGTRQKKKLTATGKEAQFNKSFLDIKPVPL